MKGILSLAAVLVLAHAANAQCGPLGCNVGPQVSHAATAPVRFVRGGIDAARPVFLSAEAGRPGLFPLRRSGCR